MRFQGMVAAYRLVPNSLLAAVSGTVVGAELLAAIGLAVPVLAPAGAGLGALLCLIFGAAIGINLLLGRKDIDCGCEPGRNATPISWKAAARNLGFALLLGACAWLPLRIPLALWVQGLAGSVLLHVLLRAFTTIHAALAANNRRL